MPEGPGKPYALKPDGHACVDEEVQQLHSIRARDHQIRLWQLPAGFASPTERTPQFHDTMTPANPVLLGSPLPPERTLLDVWQWSTATHWGSQEIMSMES